MYRYFLYVSAVTLFIIVFAACAGNHLPEIPPGHPAHPETSSAPAYGPSESLMNHDPRPEAVPPEMSGNMRDMRMEDKQNSPKQARAFICPMHPAQHSDRAGKCKICGMALVRNKGGEQ